MKIVNFIKIVLLLTLLSVSSYSIGQTETSQVSRVQRAIYIYNLAQQVSWPTDLNNTIRTGVLGPDRATTDFKAMAQIRQIQSLPVDVVNFLSVKDIENIDILYVNRTYNFQMPYILQSVKDQGILVISEDYTFNASMINIVKVGNTFRHQINEQLLMDNCFAFAPSLKSFAIETSEKWMSLFQVSQDSLEVSRKKVRVKDSLILLKEGELLHKNEQIDTIQKIVKKKNNSIKELLAIDEIRKKTIQEKREIAQDLETKIAYQIRELEQQDSILLLRSQELTIGQDSINRQKAAILIQEEELNKQSFELTLRENINWLLAIIAGLLLIAGFIAYKNYRNKDRLSKELISKNAKITLQSEELRQKNEDLEQFAYIASHDLQEPLNTISSFIGLIKNDYKEHFDDIGKQSLDFIEDASTRMTKLIEVLLEYSRIGKGRIFTPVNCDQLMQDLEKDISLLIKQKQATILYTNMPTVSGSEIELRLLFQNLVTNALKFCPNDRLPLLKIDVIKTTSTEDPNEEVWQFSFKDNGIGIEKEHQERIFSIFQRLHTSEEYDGTGIGLAHCKKIVAIHRGEIWLDSAVNVGSTFYFTIPC